MPRSVDEWVGKTDDTPVPGRVKVRVFQRCKGCCHRCGRKIPVGDQWVLEHRVAIINLGANAESNLCLTCSWCKPAKDAEDVAIKAKTYAKQKAYLLPREPGRLQSRGFPKREKQRTATRPPLKRTYAQEEDDVDV